MTQSAYQRVSRNAVPSILIYIGGGYGGAEILWLVFEVIVKN